MGRSKFILGGLFILAAVVYLIFSSTQQSAEYFMTVDELKTKGSQVIDKSLRLSGAPNVRDASRLIGRGCPS